MMFEWKNDWFSIQYDQLDVNGREEIRTLPTLGHIELKYLKYMKGKDIS